MKAFLSVLFVALIGMIFWVRHVSVRPTEAHRKIIASLKEELEHSENERDRLASELARAKVALNAVSDSSRADSGNVAAAFAGRPLEPFAEPEPVPASVSPVPEGGLEGRVKRLAEIYHENHAALMKKKAGFQSSLDALQARRITIADRPMNFSELSTLTDGEGNITRLRGVRTSDADRSRAITKREEEIALIDAEIKKLSVELAGTEAEIRRLDELYRNAISKAKAEFGGR